MPSSLCFSPDSVPYIVPLFQETETFSMEYNLYSTNLDHGKILNVCWLEQVSYALCFSGLCDILLMCSFCE